MYYKTVEYSTAQVGTVHMQVAIGHIVQVSVGSIVEVSIVTVVSQPHCHVVAMWLI